ncbi:hypothetical protein IE53DRAFT_232393, partial [Violaceomyces palustris]
PPPFLSLPSSRGELIIAEVSSRFKSFEDFIELVQELGFKLESKDTSNTHFVLFEFVRAGSRSEIASKRRSGSQKSEGVDVKEREEKGEGMELDQEPGADGPQEEVSDQELIQKGKEILKPCLYKRR